MDKTKVSIETLEALIFASGEPLSLEKIAEIVDLDNKEITILMDDLVSKWKDLSYGFKLFEVSENCYQFRSNPDFSLKIEKLFASRPRTLSRAMQRLWQL